jgi:hypothetical protein
MVVGDGRGSVAVGDRRGGNLGGVSDSRLLGRGERGSYVPLRIPQSQRNLIFFLVRVVPSHCLRDLLLLLQIRLVELFDLRIRPAELISRQSHDL